MKKSANKKSQVWKKSATYKCDGIVKKLKKISSWFHRGFIDDESPFHRGFVVLSGFHRGFIVKQKKYKFTTFR